MTSIFDGFEVGNKVSKEEYEATVPQLRVDLVNMQYDLQQADFPVLIVLMGNDYREVTEMLGALHEWMDARYLNTQVFLVPRREELEYPAYWRYWRVMPSDGRVGIHVGAWPLRALAERILENGTDETLERRIGHINALERALVDDRTVLLKIWLHISKKEVKRRRKKAKGTPNETGHATLEDWRVHDRYDESMPIVERLLHKTSSGPAPWHIVESTNARYRNLTVARRILTSVHERLDAPEAPRATTPDSRPIEAEAGALDTVDLSAALERREYEERLSDLQGKLGKMVIEARGKFGTVLAFEGWDAAGKGGVIRRLTNAMFAQDYVVSPIAAPTEEERAHHYLWRFWRRVPRQGQIVIFDRTWYGRVLVERVEGFATPDEWRRAYAEIRDFEAQLVHHGTVLCKFWMHIDPDEQLRRFEAREKIGYKKYKITDEDYRNRDRWSAYTRAVNEMVARTSTQGAPWHLIAANDKKWARVQVLEKVVAALQKRLGEV